MMAEEDPDVTTTATDEERPRKEAAAPAWLAGAVDADGFPVDMTLEEKRAASAPAGPAVRSASGPAEVASPVAAPSSAQPRAVSIPATAPANRATVAPVPNIPAVMPGSQPAGAPSLRRPEDAVTGISQGTSPNEIGKPVPGASGAYVLPTGNAADDRIARHAVGGTEDVDPMRARSVIAGMFAREKNIGNPFARVLAKVGTGILEGLDVAAEGTFPRYAAITPGSIMSTNIQNAKADSKANTEAQLSIEQEKADAERDAATAKEQPRPSAPSEQAFQSLLTGAPNGGPQINPETNNPYTPLEAYQAIQKQPAAPKGTTPLSNSVIKESNEGLDPDLQLKVGASDEDLQAARAVQARRDKSKDAPQRMERVMSDGTTHAMGWNPKTQRFDIDEGISKNASEGGTAQGNLKLQGPAYLATLDPREAATVSAIGEGRLPLADVSRLLYKNPALVDEVNAAYPGYDSNQASSYTALRKDFTSGKSAVSINALNTAMQHLALMNQSVSALGTIPGVRSIAQMAGNKEATQLNAAKEAVTEELAKAYKGSGVISESEEKQWNSLLNVTSPAELRANIKAVTNLLYGKMESLKSSWENGMPEGVPVPVQILQDQGLQAYHSITGEMPPDASLYQGRGSAGSQAAARAATPNPSQRGNTAGSRSKAEQWSVPKDAPSAAKVPDGKILKQNGKIIARAQGGQWVQP